MYERLHTNISELNRTIISLTEKGGHWQKVSQVSLGLKVDQLPLWSKNKNTNPLGPSTNINNK